MCLQWGRPRFNPWVKKIPWKREWQPSLVSLPGEFHGQRNLAGYRLWDHKESDTTEQLTHTQTLIYTKTKYFCLIVRNAKTMDIKGRLYTWTLYHECSTFCKITLSIATLFTTFESHFYIPNPSAFVTVMFTVILQIDANIWFLYFSFIIANDQLFSY